MWIKLEYFIIVIVHIQYSWSLSCQYRDVGEFPELIYSYLTDWGCYQFTRTDLFVGGQIQLKACSIKLNEQIYRVPGVLDDEINCIPFHHNSTIIQKRVQNSFLNDMIYNRWLSCCKDALKCCQEHLANAVERDGFCAPLWDGWSCIDFSAAGSNAHQVCSPYSYSRQSPRCNHFSSKECFLNATWNPRTDYSTCSITPRLIRRTNWHIAMLSVSIVIGFPAMIFLIFYKGAQLQKIQLIRNLIIALLVRNSLVLMSQTLIVMDELTGIDNSTAMSNNSAACKILAFMEKLATNIIFTCMLLEAIFLHQLITNVFASRGQSGLKMLWFHIAGIVIAITSALIWAVVTAVYADEHCWFVSDSNEFHWINDTPRLIMLITGTVLLMHIIYTLWKSFNRHQNEHIATLRTAKVSLLCMPLFGFPFLFFIIHPDTDSCSAEQTYYFLYYALEGLQGACVAILHCYCDKEIVKYWRRKFEDYSERLKWTIPRKSRHERRSTWTTTDHRRSTMNTIAQSIQTNSNSIVESNTNHNHAQTENPILPQNFDSDSKQPIPKSEKGKIVLNLRNDSQNSEYVI